MYQVIQFINYVLYNDSTVAFIIRLGSLLAAISIISKCVLWLWKTLRRLKPSGRAIRAIHVTPPIRISLLIALVLGLIGIFLAMPITHNIGLSSKSIPSTGMAHPGIYALVWAPDARTIAVAKQKGETGQEIDVIGFNVSQNQNLFSYQPPDGSLALALAWSPDSKYLATGWNDNKVQIWDIATGKNVLTYDRNAGPVTAIAWSADGNRIISVANGVAKMWNAASGQDIFTMNSEDITAVVWSPSSKYFATGDQNGRTQVWDAQKGSVIVTLPYTGDSAITAIAWSIDGIRVAVGRNNGAISAWEWQTSRPIALHGTSPLQTIDALSISPDGFGIVAGGKPGLIAVWALNSGKLLITRSDDSQEVYGVSWAPDGSTIAGGGTNNIISYTPAPYPVPPA